MSDELKVGYGRFDPNPQPLTPGQSKILDALKALPLATFAERREAEIATLRTQLAAMTAERDSLLADWNAIVKASGSKTNGGAVGHVAALVRERDAALAKVAMLREALQYVDWRLYFDGGEGRYVAKDDYDGNVIDAALEKTR